MHRPLVLLAVALACCRESPKSASEPAAASSAFRCVLDGERFAPDVDSEWRGYTLKTLNRSPRQTLLEGLARLGEASVVALDLGAGAGNDVRHLLARGHRVHAVEPDPFAVAVIEECARQQETAEALTVQPATFEAMRLPEKEFMLVHASLSLPFTHPEAFPEVWSKIVASMAEGAVFSGDFFGPRHAWADNPEMTFLSPEEVRALFTEHGLRIVRLEEEDGPRPLAEGGEARFHRISVIARR